MKHLKTYESFSDEFLETIPSDDHFKNHYDVLKSISKQLASDVDIEDDWNYRFDDFIIPDDFVIDTILVFRKKDQIPTRVKVLFKDLIGWKADFSRDIEKNKESGGQNPYLTAVEHSIVDIPYGRGIFYKFNSNKGITYSRLDNRYYFNTDLVKAALHPGIYGGEIPVSKEYTKPHHSHYSKTIEKDYINLPLEIEDFKKQEHITKYLYELFGEWFMKNIKYLNSLGFNFNPKLPHKPNALDFKKFLLSRISRSRYYYNKNYEYPYRYEIINPHKVKFHYTVSELVQMWMNIEIRNSYYIISFDILCPNVLDVHPTYRYQEDAHIPMPGEVGHEDLDEKDIKERKKQQKRRKLMYQKEEGISFEEKFESKDEKKDAILNPNTKFKQRENVLRFRVKSIHKLLHEAGLKKMLGDKINHLLFNCKIGKNYAELIVSYYPKLEGHI